MTFIDPVGDMITRIRNAQMRLLNNVVIPNSKFRAKILDILKQEGYISDYKFLSTFMTGSGIISNSVQIASMSAGIVSSSGQVSDYFSDAFQFLLNPPI